MINIGSGIWARCKNVAYRKKAGVELSEDLTPVGAVGDPVPGRTGISGVTGVRSRWELARRELQEFVLVVSF